MFTLKRFRRHRNFGSKRFMQRPTFPRVETTTLEQEKSLFIQSAIPMAGFSFMDLSVMLHAGNFIDCTLGVTFGMSTLASAAFGQVISNTSGVLFGRSLESFCNRYMLTSKDMTLDQKRLPRSRRIRLYGSLGGVLVGCVIGLVNLAFIDTQKSSQLKLTSRTDDNEFEYQVCALNSENGLTTLTVQGPDVDGLLASMTHALTLSGCSIVELSSKQIGINKVENIFTVVNSESREQVEKKHLLRVSEDLLSATKVKLNASLLTKELKQISKEKDTLQTRVNKLEDAMRRHQIHIESQFPNS